MSLLLDALKRAEEAKRAARLAGGDSAGTTPDHRGVRESVAIPSIDLPSETPLPEKKPRTSFPALALEDDLVEDLPALAPTPSQAAPLPPPPPNPADFAGPDTGGLSLELLDSIPVASGNDDQNGAPTHDATAEMAALTPARRDPTLSAAAPTRPPARATSSVPEGGARPNVQTASQSDRGSGATTRIAVIDTASASSVVTSTGSTSSDTVPGVATATALTASEDGKQRESVKNIFAAKRSAAESSRPRWVLPVVVLCLGVAGAGGWYVWNEVNRSAKSAFATPASRQAAIGSIARPPVPEAAPSAGVTAASVPATKASSGSAAPNVSGSSPRIAEAAAKPAETLLPPLIPPESTVLPSASADPGPRSPGQPGSSRRNRAPPADPREQLIGELQKQPAPNPSNAPLKLSRQSEVKPVSPAMTDAYAALVSGDLAKAKRLYGALIDENPSEVDAHLGFATAAARMGDSQLALSHYRRVLELDPRNPTAGGGLVSISAEMGAANAEAELRALIARDGESAALYFALGNVYARARRWQDAQAAYFDALRIEPSNADFAYNLAVSLDRLGRPALALDHYRRALQANARVSFNREAVQKRVAEIDERSTPR